MTLPRMTEEPCWLSRLISGLMIGSVLMLLSNCRGPSTLEELLSGTATSLGWLVVV